MTERSKKRRLARENEQLRELVNELGTHLLALCNHPVNFENRYDTEQGRPCAGCYDARDHFEAWLAERAPAARQTDP